MLVPVALIALGTADMSAFDARATSLEKSWQADEAAGVPHDQLAPARASLEALRDRRIAGLVPYALVSWAFLIDPFSRPESLASRGQAAALAQARTRARNDLANLKQLGGPNYDGARSHTAQLDAARTLPQYVRLANTWEAEARSLSATRDQLSQVAGGLTDGLPTDVVNGAARLQSVVSSAGQAQLSPNPAAQALSQAQAYLKLPYAAELQQHDAVAGQVKSAGDTVQHRIDMYAQDGQMLGQLPDLLNQAGKYNVTGSFPARASQAKVDVQAAEAASDDGKMQAATTELQGVFNDLSSAVANARQAANAAALASGNGCIDGAPAQLIIVHLATQQLVAYNNGCPMLRSPVTTGRPALPTDRGTFHIFAKYPQYHMISPWPQGSPYYYPPTWVNDAMEFVSDGTFIHGASWEPVSAYGAGSENGSYASHGCVHVPDDALGQLYAWAQVGTTVTVTD